MKIIRIMLAIVLAFTAAFVLATVDGDLANNISAVRLLMGLTTAAVLLVVWPNFCR